MNCPFKQGAVQAQAARLADKFEYDGDYGAALKSARGQFGQCDQEECACWSWQDEQDSTFGWCGLISPRP